MMLQIGEDGVVSKVDEEELIYVDKKELEELIERYTHLEEENEQLKSEIEKLSYANEDLLSEKRNWQRMSDEYCKLSEENEQLKKALWCIRKRYGYSIEEFVEDLKDNGIDLTKVDLE